VLPAFLMLDLVHGVRHFWTSRWWRTRALLVSAAVVAFSVVIAGFWGRVFDGVALLPGHELGFAGGTAVGILVYEFCHYWYHRAAHAWTPLWRAAHQMHHSAESLDAFGAYYLSPLDTVAFTTISSLVLFPLLGLTLEAGLAASAFIAFCAAFQHANLRTPRWLGYLVQRPESHAVHHERGVHRWNYSDLPLWDIVFGTFRNPAEWHGKVGFYHGASLRIPEMLVGLDVSTPRAGERPPAVPVASNAVRTAAAAPARPTAIALETLRRTAGVAPEPSTRF
jgi:sterol desaturase/sphingolipid hydroxylase (fatty acid hydroxylase superfamily)